MRSFVRRLTTGFFLTLVALALPVGAQADVSITFGVYTSDKPSAMVRQLRPIASGSNERPLMAAGSTGRRNTSFKSLCRCFEV